jgi:rubrerythrin
MEMEEVCYTRETALEKAIDIEMKSFQNYRKAYRRVRDQQARSLVKEIALDELDHKNTLEKAFFEETIALHDAGMEEAPSMKLSIMLEEKPLDENATDQDVMIHAIHDKKRAVDFYRKMASQCGGAPMERMFQQLSRDEENHLARLESLYESVYMQEM